MPHRVAVVGAGRWGTVLIKTLARLGTFELRWLISRQSELELPPNISCRVTGDWRKALADDELDGILIASPPAEHFAVAFAAIEAGKAVMIEKPLTLQVDQAEKLLAAAQASGGRVLVDHTHLYSPAYRRLRSLVQHATPIRSVVARSGNWGPFRRNNPVLWDWAAHDIAMCIDLVGLVPSEIYLDKMVWREQSTGPGEQYEFRLIFENGVVAFIHTGNLATLKQRYLKVVVSDASFVYDDMAEHKLSRAVGPDTSDTTLDYIEYTHQLPVDCMLGEFASLCGSSEPGFASLELGVKVVRVLDKLGNLAKAHTFNAKP